MEAASSGSKRRRDEEPKGLAQEAHVNQRQRITGRGLSLPGSSSAEPSAAAASLPSSVLPSMLHSHSISSPAPPALDLGAQLPASAPALALASASGSGPASLTELRQAELAVLPAERTVRRMLLAQERQDFWPKLLAMEQRRQDDHASAAYIRAQALTNGAQPEEPKGPFADTERLLQAHLVPKACEDLVLQLLRPPPMASACALPSAAASSASAPEQQDSWADDGGDLDPPPQEYGVEEMQEAGMETLVEASAAEGRNVQTVSAPFGVSLPAPGLSLSSVPVELSVVPFCQVQACMYVLWQELVQRSTVLHTLEVQQAQSIWHSLLEDPDGVRRVTEEAESDDTFQQAAHHSLRRMYAVLAPEVAAPRHLYSMPSFPASGAWQEWIRHVERARGALEECYESVATRARLLHEFPHPHTSSPHAAEFSRETSALKEHLRGLVAALNSLAHVDFQVLEHEAYQVIPTAPQRQQQRGAAGEPGPQSASAPASAACAPAAAGAALSSSVPVSGPLLLFRECPLNAVLLLSHLLDRSRLLLRSGNLQRPAGECCHEEGEKMNRMLGDILDERSPQSKSMRLVCEMLPALRNLYHMQVAYLRDLPVGFLNESGLLVEYARARHELWAQGALPWNNGESGGEACQSEGEASALPPPIAFEPGLLEHLLRSHSGRSLLDINVRSRFPPFHSLVHMACLRPRHLFNESPVWSLLRLNMTSHGLDTAVYLHPEDKHAWSAFLREIPMPEEGEGEGAGPVPSSRALREEERLLLQFAFYQRHMRRAHRNLLGQMPAAALGEPGLALWILQLLGTETAPEAAALARADEKRKGI